MSNLRRLYVVMLMFSFFVVSSAPLAGCVMDDKSPYEKAILSSTAATETYYLLRNTYTELLTALPDKADYLKENVAPKLNQLQNALVVWRSLVLLWGQNNVKPEMYDGVQNEVVTLGSELSKDIGTITGEQLNIPSK